MSWTIRAPLPCLLPLILSVVLAACGGGGGGPTGASSGSPDAAPTVTAPAAASIDATGATLSGSVTSNGLPTECWFEYGTDATLDTCGSTARQSVAPGAAGQAVADTITGLAPGTVYHYRICASNSLGTTRSPIGWFETSATYSCVDCHGGVDGSRPGVNGAPVVTRYWQTSGHGKPGRGLPLRCEDCHDAGSPAGAHAADGTGTFNTLAWPGKPDNTVNANTAHLRSFFFPASPAAAADHVIAFDNACGNRSGCHVRTDGTRAAALMGHAKDGVLEFGTRSTTPNPKLYTWYVRNSYADDFYKSPSVWTVGDLSTDAAGAIHYGTCVSCHDPHGSGTTDRTGAGRNVMVRGNWISETSQFCTAACHRSP